MDFEDLDELLFVVVHLEEVATFGAEIDIGYCMFFVIEFKVEDCECGVAGMVIEDNACTWEVTFFDTPESDVFVAAGNESIVVDRGELDAEDID